MSKGIVILISGPSGVGKGTVVKEILKDKEKYALSISATTRKKREGEVDGVSYFFISESEFRSRIEQGLMLEYAEYCGNFYGTPKAYVDEMIDKGKNVILEIEVQGAENVKSIMPEAVSIFVMPPSLNALESRLRSRGTEDEETIRKRLATAAVEMKKAVCYDYIVVNDRLEDCIDDVKSVISAESHKNINMVNFVKEVLEK